MNIPLVDLSRQHQQLREPLAKAIESVIESSHFINGEETKKFERNFAQYCNTDYCVGVGNGTDALFLSLKALGVGAGDKVLTAANSFFATSEAITATGATPVFIDCDLKTQNIDLTLLEKELQTNPKSYRAIIPVHLYGQMVNMDKIMGLAKQYDLFVIEDAAQAHGAQWNGKKAGSWGDCGCFSFYPGKNLGAMGDAGAVVTNSESLAQQVRMLANHGRTDKYNHKTEGINSRLDSIQAAVLNVKLDYLDQWIKDRQRLAQRYSVKLKAVEEEFFNTPFIPDDQSHVFHLYVLRSTRRDELKTHLAAKQIATGIHYPIMLPDLEAYKYLELNKEQFLVSGRLQNEILSLPLFPELTEQEQDKVIQEVINFYSEAAKMIRT